jgi:predicted pyridoxine 5'-phosphate oxidase superfamily flavin-nucleotide-binding protein
MEHRGERAVQRRVGFPDRPWGSARVGAAVPDVAAEFLRRQRLVVIGAATPDGSVWAAPLTGEPGFVTAPDDRTVVARRTPAPGDPLAEVFDTELSGRGHDVGMLAIEPASRRRMRVNGRARQVGDRLVVHTEQVYANCPKYIQARDVETVTPATTVTAVPSDQLSPGQRAWITGADTFFVATHAPGVGADASHRGGSPGFVTVTGDRQLSWPDYLGNSMYMTLGNLELDPRAGLLFLDWERGRSLMVTGRARVDWDPRRAEGVPGAQRIVDFAVDRVVQLDGAVPLRWTAPEYSRFNPAVEEPRVIGA